MTEHGLRLRPIEPRDIPAVAQLHSRAFNSSAWSLNTFRDEIEHSRISIFYLLEYTAASTVLHTGPHSARHSPEPQLLSMFGCWHVLEDLYLASIAVEPRLQRCGLGELTLRTILRLAQRLPADTIRLDLRASNHAALALYRKYGFRLDGRRRNLYARPREDGLQMIRTADDIKLPHAVPVRLAAQWPGPLRIHWRGGAVETWPSQDPAEPAL